MNDNWIDCKKELPKEGLVVMTKIAYPDRNIQRLYRFKNLWFVEDGSVYVYYTPTHWRPIEK